MTTTSMDQTYEDMEARMLVRKLAAVENQPLADRKAAAVDYWEALADPGLLHQRAGWLLEGSYGYGPWKAAHKIKARDRGNRAAALAVLLAALEWNCPARAAAAAYCSLAPSQQTAITKAITKALDKEPVS